MGLPTSTCIQQMPRSTRARWMEAVVSRSTFGPGVLGRSWRGPPMVLRSPTSRSDLFSLCVPVQAGLGPAIPYPCMESARNPGLVDHQIDDGPRNCQCVGVVLGLGDGITDVPEPLGLGHYECEEG
jgi:hypothetical protein